MSRRRSRSSVTTTQIVPEVTEAVEVTNTPRKIRAACDMAGIAKKGEDLVEIVEYASTIGTLGNSTDVVVKNQQGGLSIIPIENVLFEEDGVVSDQEENPEVDDSAVVNEGEEDSSTVQDDQV